VAASWPLTSPINKAPLCHAFKYLRFKNYILSFFSGTAKSLLSYQNVFYNLDEYVLPSCFFFAAVTFKRTFCFTNENGVFYVKEEFFCLLSSGPPLSLFFFYHVRTCLKHLHTQTVQQHRSLNVHSFKPDRKLRN